MSSTTLRNVTVNIRSPFVEICDAQGRTTFFHAGHVTRIRKKSRHLQILTVGGDSDFIRLELDVERENQGREERRPFRDPDILDMEGIALASEAACFENHWALNDPVVDLILSSLTEAGLYRRG